MSDKQIGLSQTSAEVEASREIYSIARQESDIELARLKAEIPAKEVDSFAIGAIKANKAYRDYADFLDAMVLYRAHKNKTYKAQGLTWEQFCDAAGYERKNAERIINDIDPIFKTFSDNLSILSGVGMNEIRWLGKNVVGKTGQMSGFDADGNLVIGEDKIPGTAEDIMAYIKAQKEAHKAATEDLEASLSAQKKVTEAKEQLINNLEKDLKRLEKNIVPTGLTPEEQDAVDMLVKIQKDFMMWIMDIKKKIEPRKAPEIALRQLYYLYIFISKIAMEERLALQDAYPPAEDVPWEITEDEIPPPEILIDNMPGTYGKGMGAKVREAIDKRAAKH